MTRSSRCRDIERIMLEGEDRALPAGERGLVEEHVRACARCRGFAADRALVRAELAGVRWPAPPEELVLRTRRLLRGAGATAPPVVPVWVLVAMAAVTIITSIWLAVTLPDITPEISLAALPFGGLVAIFIIVQNALMLFCAPIVLRTARARRDKLESAR
jgi:predicted anti-sigma-YlaC factor YlaD